MKTAAELEKLIRQLKAFNPGMELRQRGTTISKGFIDLRSFPRPKPTDPPPTPWIVPDHLEEVKRLILERWNENLNRHHATTQEKP